VNSSHCWIRSAKIAPRNLILNRGQGTSYSLGKRKGFRGEGGKWRWGGGVEGRRTRHYVLACAWSRGGRGHLRTRTARGRDYALGTLRREKTSKNGLKKRWEVAKHATISSLREERTITGKEHG